MSSFEMHWWLNIFLYKIPYWVFESIISLRFAVSWIGNKEWIEVLHRNHWLTQQRFEIPTQASVFAAVNSDSEDFVLKSNEKRTKKNIAFSIKTRRVVILPSLSMPLSKFVWNVLINKFTTSVLGWSKSRFY